MKNKKQIIFMICLCAAFTALNVVMSSFSVPVPGGHLYLNDIIIDVAAIFLPPPLAFIAGGVGAFLGDLFFYPVAMFVSLAVRGLQALAISLISHYTFKHKPDAASITGAAVGALISVIGYHLGRSFVYSTPAYAWAKLPYQLIMAFGGGAIAVVLCLRKGVLKFLFAKTDIRN